MLNLHGLLANNLLADPSAIGRLRHIIVGIERSAFHPLEIPGLIEEYFDLLLAKAALIEDPFEQVFFVMVQLPYLQPFDDVNKRVSRLAANIPLIRANLAPLSFTDVPDELYTQAILGVYELNRVELLKDVFVWAYQRSAAGMLPCGSRWANPFRSVCAIARSSPKLCAARSPASGRCPRPLQGWGSDPVRRSGSIRGSRGNRVACPP